ncbi:MAG TPA: FAD-dependent oxidoreductase [Polyangia bacterium]|jgi:2-polyprenyl-6-methoxyphenol hydroxylase-like FAD-dependent oxidoreductase
MRVLVVGAGIAGLSFALCLRRAGHSVVVLEKAHRLRDEGYMIDFFGSGYDAAERLGLLPEIARIHYPVDSLAFVDEDGHERFALPYPVLRRLLFGDRHFNFMRGDLEHLLHDALPAGTEIRFGTTVDQLDNIGGGVEVKLSDGSMQLFDLVVGADGVHSRVRELAFGGEKEFLRPLGYRTLAFIVEDPELHALVGNAFRTLTTPGRQVAVYALRGNRVATFFIHQAEGDAPPDFGLAAARDELRRVYGAMDWLVPDLIVRCGENSQVYFDEVAQIVVPSWHRGRIVLLGDACQCVSLLAGQGASMALAGAYVLAEELAEGEDIAFALARYENRMQPSIETKQASGRNLARWFVPRGPLRLAMRDLFMRLSTWRPVAHFVRRQLAADSVVTRAAI